jgi:UDP-2,3-diacylglucosamine hydrolase
MREDRTGSERPVVSTAGDDLVLFASDMHLGEHDPGTVDFFFEALARESSAITHLFLLGDLFEAWVGDDQSDAIAERLIEALAGLHARGVWIGVMVGNRDFLLNLPVAAGASFSLRSGAVMLADPTRVDLFGQPTLLAHGDAWCLSDVDYQRFRAQVRLPGWQQVFLAKPLPERLAVARALRSESEKRRAITDIDPSAAAAQMRAAGVSRLIHGHTHQPGESVLEGEPPAELRRYVLPDWSAAEGRGGFLKVNRQGWSRTAAVQT